MNEHRTCANPCTPLTQAGSPPVRFELIDKNGVPWASDFTSATAAADKARKLWPDQEQDPERTGKGWDIQIAGAE